MLSTLSRRSLNTALLRANKAPSSSFNKQGGLLSSSRFQYQSRGHQSSSNEEFYSQKTTTSSFTESNNLLWLSVAAGCIGVATFSLFASASDKQQIEVEAAVATVDELKDGQLKQVKVGEVDILLSRINGLYYATDLKCTHYGAPLNTGQLVGDFVFCPWHCAQFNVKTGRAETSPAIDDLNTYPVRIEGNKVIVGVPAGNKVPPTHKAVVAYQESGSDKRTFVIIGTGAAGTVAAETLREDGFKGKILLVTAEDLPPYDRVPLSKAIGVPADKVVLRNDDFYKKIGVDLLKGKQVVDVNNAKKTVTFKDGQTVQFDSLLVASGAAPRKLNIPGAQLGNVFTLRDPKDSAGIDAAVKEAKSVVIIGSSFIGMEVAACLKKNKGVEKVIVVGQENVPFERVLGKEVGAALQGWFEENGVSFRLATGVKEFQGKDKVEKVVLSNGETIPADAVVVGAGVIPNTSFLKNLAPLKKDGGVTVDQYLQVVDGVYAAGDIAHFPYRGEEIRVEHWAVAQQQGRIAAHNMLGLQVPYETIPFFWSNAFGSGFKYAGHASSFDDVAVVGDTKKRQFLAYYGKQGEVKAVLGMGKNLVPSLELLRLGKLPPIDQLKSGKVDVDSLLVKIQATH